MLTAISAGVTALIAVPMGVWIVRVFSAATPAAISRWFTKSVFFAEPITPTYA